MESIKRTNIIVRTRRRVVIMSGQTFDPPLCVHCDEPMVTVQSCSEIFGVGSRVLYRQIENDAIHFLETDNHEMYLCPKTVNAALEKAGEICRENQGFIPLH